MKLDNLNILRAISILAIIFGHGCLQFRYEPMARFCGYLFVQIFFLLSAFLLGLKYGESPLSCNFIGKRWWRLSKVYYPFLLISIVSLYAMGEMPSWSCILAHIVYMNYPLQTDLGGTGFGHLWYLSMLMLCYLLVLVACSKPLFGLAKRVLQNRYGVLAIALLTLGVGYACTQIGVPCRIPIVLASFLVVFVNARRIVEASNNFKLGSWIPFILLNGLCLGLFLYWNLNAKLLIRDVLVLITAMSWMWLFLSSLRTMKCPRILGWISTISFELYLVHSPFVVGEHSWLTYSPFSWVYTAIVCVVLAWGLHKVTCIK